MGSMGEEFILSHSSLFFSVLARIPFLHIICHQMSKLTYVRNVHSNFRYIYVPLTY